MLPPKINHPPADYPHGPNIFPIRLLGQPLLALQLSPAPAVPWKRQRGPKGSFKHPRLAAWQNEVREIVESELAAAGEAAGPLAHLPFCDQLTRTLVIGIELRFDSESALNRAGDPDNYEKAIWDALRGVLWKDDRSRYIRLHWLHATWSISNPGVYLYVHEYSGG